MNPNEMSAIGQSFKNELAAAHEVIGDMAVQMQTDSAEYREQIEKALIKISDLSKALPAHLRSCVDGELRTGMNSLSKQLTQAVTCDAEDAAMQAKTTICEVQNAADQALKSVVSSSWKILLVLWISPVFMLVASGSLVSALYHEKLGELSAIAKDVQTLRTQYAKLLASTGGMRFDVSNPKKPILFIPSAVSFATCTLKNGDGGRCFYP